jgi:hypothetical protein
MNARPTNVEKNPGGVSQKLNWRVAAKNGSISSKTPTNVPSSGLSENSSRLNEHTTHRGIED